MSQFRNMPAIQDILRALGTGETLSRKEILAKVGREMKREQQDKMVDAGFVVIQPSGQTHRYTLTSEGMAYVRDELGGAVRAAPQDISRLPAKERIAVFALLSPCLQMSYSDVRKSLGIGIAKRERDTLASKGLLIVIDNPLRFELTEKGWNVAEEELRRAPRADDPPLLKVLHHHWSQTLGELDTRDMGLVDLFAEDRTGRAEVTPRRTKTLGARVIDAYEELVYQPGGWVSLTRLRDHLSDVERPELDEVLSALFRENRISLIAEVNQKILSEQDRQAALRIVGDEKHLYAVR